MEGACKSAHYIGIACGIGSNAVAHALTGVVGNCGPLPCGLRLYEQREETKSYEAECFHF